MDIQDWYAPARIRVLLAPVPPIRRATFAKYVDIFNRFRVISLADLTPPDPKSVTNPFTETLFHEGLMHFHFVTSYNPEHAPLEDFQVHRQVLGIIGIMDCQQAPLFSQASHDTKGLIMIPNVGDVTFYLNTMMQDFASELLKTFGNLASLIEKIPVIVGPTMPSPISHQNSSSATSSPLTSPMAERPSTPIAPPSKPQSAHVVLTDRTASSPAILMDQIASPATASGFGAALGSVGAAMGSLLAQDKNKRRTPSRILMLIGDLYLLAGRLDYAIQNYTQCIEAMKANGDHQWQAAAVDSYYCAILLSLLGKTATGSLSDRSSEVSSSELSTDTLSRDAKRGPKILEMPSVKDLFDEAANPDSPIRSLFCELPEKYREIVTLHEKSATKDSPGFYPLLQIATCLKMARLLAAMTKYHFSAQILNGAAMPMNIIEIKGLSEIAASINMTRPVTGSIRVAVGAGTPNDVMNSTGQIDKDRIVLNNGIGASRVDVSSWLMKVTSLGLEYLSISDQTWAATVMASIYGQIGYKRKHSMFLRHAGLLVLSTLKRTLGVRRLSDVYEPVGPGGQIAPVSDVAFRHIESSPHSNVSSNGALECMRRVSEILGVGEVHVHSSSVGAKDEHDTASSDENEDEADDWMEDFENRHDLDLFLKDGPAAVGRFRIPIILAHRLRHGWPELQIQVLKECIDIADASSDYQSTIIFATRLLRRLHLYLRKGEQLELVELLESVVRRTKSNGDASGDSVSKRAVAPVALVKGVLGGVCGVPVLRSIEVVGQTPRRVPYRHNRSEIALKDGAGSPKAVRDPFITNAWKGQHEHPARKYPAETILVANEVAYFDVVLANPFAFELEIQSLIVKTSGIEFAPVSLATTIPPFERIHLLRLSGTPKTAGMLTIIGCTVRLFNGSLEEDIRPIGKGLGGSKHVKRQKQSDRERLGIHGSLALCEGEVSKLTCKLENTSAAITIDYITVAFSESSLASATRNDVIEDPEITYERDVHDRSLRTLWLDGGKLKQSTSGGPVGDAVVEALDVELKPGESKEIVVGVYGKSTCTGGAIIINYGHIKGSSADTQYFYTREFAVPILLTVHRALEAFSLDVLLLGGLGPVETTNASNVNHTITKERSLSLEDLVIDSVGISEEEKAVGIIPVEKRNDYALVTFDLRNTSAAVFEVSFDLYDAEDNPEAVEEPFQVTTLLCAHQTKRIVLPIKRIRISEAVAYQPIPFPDWKQFVRTQRPKFSESQEYMRRALFWYKEELVGGLKGRGRIVGRWLTSKGRRGKFSLRNIYLTPPMLTSLQREQVSFQARVVPLEGSNTDTIESIKLTHGRRYVCPAREFVALEWTVINRMEHPAKFLLRILPVQDHQNGNFDIHVADQLFYGGSLEHAFPLLPPTEGSGSYRIPCMFRGTGEYKFIYHVENRYKSPSKIGDGVGLDGISKTSNEVKVPPSHRIEENTFWAPEPLIVVVE
ncbi:hypothetical protein SeMB42_g07142 [Synchytrium endobioticum]|uniref:Uncharacterized protein n=1 Tax=Synchytrium endobioticum TaxID=286115 RepID=A0A507C2S6_9FUNG|nr:hypothetical protein SeMB42_g07142 [Synchytrium endobioticum]